MKIISMQLLKEIGLGRCLEQGRAHIGIPVHGTAAVHQHDELDRILARVLHAYLKETRIIAGILYGAIYIQFLLSIGVIRAELP